MATALALASRGHALDRFGSTQDLLAEIREGIRYAMSRSELRRPIVTSIIVIMFGFSYVAFQPALVEGVFGLGDRQVGFISLIQTIVMRATDEAYQGRVQSLVQLPFAALAMAAAPLGALAEWAGVRTMFMTMGIAVRLSMVVCSMAAVSDRRTAQPATSH
ncbi:MAG: hypothetical protein OXH86_05680 [Acidimicrobiaceae bacterium]|nr:hypothetical protein [Acidimicrobiaceae bacterium]